jgi:hypothetical protein
MKRVLPTLCFSYGCFATLALLAWHVAALGGIVAFPNNGSIITPVFMIHAVVLLITFERNPKGVIPVLNVTPRRVRMAKFCLGLAVAYFTLYMLFLWGQFLTDSETAPRVLLLLLTSLLLVNSIYIVVHWAFRPENLFSERFRNVITNPILYWFFRTPITRGHREDEE